MPVPLLDTPVHPASASEQDEGRTLYDLPAASDVLKRRHVFYLAGYDTIGVGWYRLFRRELRKFAATWNVSAAISDLTPGTSLGTNPGPSSDSSEAAPSWRINTTASNWSVETVYEPLLWDDLVRADQARPMWRRLLLSPGAFLDMVGSGAFVRYCRANWQYALFFLFPYATLLLFAAVAIAVAAFAASAIGLSGLLHIALSGLLAAGIFAVLLRWPGRKLGIDHALDDWIFSRDYVHGRRPDLDARLDRFCERIVACARNGASDEILIVGHSLGATLALEILARALERHPGFARPHVPVHLLTVGSTIAKFTLHPAGDRIRRCAAQVVEAPSISWAEYHARSDAISFYKFDPVSLTRFPGDPMTGKPVMRRVKMNQMLRRNTFWRYRLKFMRLHYQFVMANECRSTYDYFMMVCGPVPFSRMVLTRDGAAELIAPDGSLLAPDLLAPDLLAPDLPAPPTAVA